MDEANFVKSENCDIGQTIIVLSNLSKEVGWTRDMIRGSLKRLEESGYIEVSTRYQKKGMLITIHDYKKLQSLGFYKTEKESQNPHENPHGESHENPHESDFLNADRSKREGGLENQIPHENPHETQQEEPHTITALFNSINNSNINIKDKTLVDVLEEANLKSYNLKTKSDIELFVDFVLKINVLPDNVSRKILTSYFDTIRMTRQTCTISAKVLAKFIERISKYSVNQIHYALWTHLEKHDDKKEQYTLGILRNTDEPEARRGLIKLKNKGGVNIATDRTSNPKEPQYDYGF